MSESIYPWQRAVWRHLTDYLSQRRIPQALLVSGADGLGKRQLVAAFAAALLCHEPHENGNACGSCGGCQLSAAGTHPDLLFIEPDEPGKAIGIDKIRQLIGKLMLKPQYEQYRVVIISPADQLNAASANAFLKCLEEPTERTCLVLISERPTRLPATIRSRCQAIVCHAPAADEAIRWLQGQGVGQRPELLLALANGAPLTAKRYADQDLLVVRQDCFEAWLQVAAGKTNLLALAEQWQKPGVLDLGLLLDWMVGWVGDIVKLAYGADGCQLRNTDIKNPLQALAKRLELTRIYAYYDSLLAAQSQLGTPINKQLLLEQLLIKWSQINTR